MKRKLCKYKIKKIHPHFFWTKCDVCNNEFKKEDMWKIIHTDHSDYVCKECAPTYEDAKMYAQNFPDSKPMRLPLRNTKDIPSANFPSPGKPPRQPRTF